MYPRKLTQVVPLSEKLSFTPAELAKATGLGRSASYRVAREIGRRFGRRLFVERQTLIEWLSASATPKRGRGRRTAKAGGISAGVRS